MTCWSLIKELTKYTLQNVELKGSMEYWCPWDIDFCTASKYILTQFEGKSIPKEIAIEKHFVTAAGLFKCNVCLFHSKNNVIGNFTEGRYSIKNALIIHVHSDCTVTVSIDRGCHAQVLR